MKIEKHCESRIFKEHLGTLVNLNGILEDRNLEVVIVNKTRDFEKILNNSI